MKHKEKELFNIVLKFGKMGHIDEVKQYINKKINKNKKTLKKREIINIIKPQVKNYEVTKK